MLLTVTSDFTQTPSSPTSMALSKGVPLALALTVLFFIPIIVALGPSLNPQELSQIPLKFLDFSKKPELVDYIINIRRRIHEYPELGFEEFETSKLIRSELDKLGIAYKHPVAVTGIVGYIGTGEPPFVALRAEMDALAIEEGVEWKHKSKAPGKMHAYGHDGHVAMLLGAAKMLQQNRHEFKETVVLVFQPAEEVGGGAKKMVEAGILENVCAIFGIHLSGRQPLGRVAGKAGPLLAGAGFFEAVISGKGGHAAIPHHTVDPVLAASNVIVSLQHLVALKTDPLNSQVVTIAKFQGGGVLNVIPDSVTIGCTFRAFSKESLIQLKQRIEENETEGPLGMSHSPYYEMNEDALSYGAALAAALATRYLFKLQSDSRSPQGNIHDEL